MSILTTAIAGTLASEYPVLSQYIVAGIEAYGEYDTLKAKASYWDSVLGKFGKIATYGPKWGRSQPKKMNGVRRNFPSRVARRYNSRSRVRPSRSRTVRVRRPVRFRRRVTRRRR